MTPPPPVQAPADLNVYLQSNFRTQSIDEHGFELNLSLWNRRIADLPGAPVRGINGATDRGIISRGALFAMADAACEDESNESAFALFWHTLAWGSGSNHRNTPQRIASVTQDTQGIGDALRFAAIASRQDEESAFRTLQPFKPLIKWWGPNFFTKYLYFAGAGNLEHRCLIVDKRVLATLSRYADAPLTPMNGSGYGYNTYSTAIEIMAGWARQLSTVERRIGFDEVERWAFKVG